ncbi:MAG: DUF3037 domain-containing protein [Salinisphaera sp.]|jgi:phage host-nuclease inhibitor protein Gam|nr:DUF3037 domain-containing protein [Salinisphaera sp.]
MNRTACQYAILRFAPFVETGEFANVGIVLCAPERRYFSFKLEKCRHKRVTDFFGDLDPRAYRRTMGDIAAELTRLQALFEDNWNATGQTSVSAADALFAELLRPRESIVRFSEPRVVLADNPEQKLAELHAYYVHRSFATPEYREEILARSMQRWLKAEHASERFAKERLGDDLFRTPELPFVERRNGGVFKVMKPLNLMQAEASRIIEHAGQWEFRLAQLKKRDLMPRQMLFAVDGPTDTGPRNKAFEEARQILADTGARVLPYRNKSEILEFALAS